MNEVSKKRLIILTPRFPYPVIGGDRLRIYFLCKELSKKYDLTLLSLCESEEEMNMDVSYDTVFSSIERVLLPKWKSVFNCLLALPTKTPLQVAYYRSTKFHLKLQAMLPNYDGALAHLVRTGDYLLDASIPKVLEMTDAISMNYERVGETAKITGFKNIVYSVEQKRLKTYERKSTEKFDFSILVSQTDKDYLFQNTPDLYNKVLVCSNGVDTKSLDYQLCTNSKQLVFIGNLYSIQNVDAALWFATNVMPLLRQKDNFTFKIIGRIKEGDKNKFENFPGVYLTGAVDCIKNEARKSLAGICSVRLGAGVQNKILEYMALGLPTITSSIGLEGIEAIPNKDILVADEPQEYVDKIMELILDNKKYINLSENGRKYVVDKHSWQSRLSPVLNAFSELLNKK